MTLAERIGREFAASYVPPELLALVLDKLVQSGVDISKPVYDPWEDYDNPLHPYRSRDLDRL